MIVPVYIVGNLFWRLFAAFKTFSVELRGRIAGKLLANALS
jgi:hypothetical protein